MKKRYELMMIDRDGCNASFTQYWTKFMAIYFAKLSATGRLRAAVVIDTKTGGCVWQSGLIWFRK